MFGKGSSASRCDLKENLLNGGCSSSAVEFPSSTLAIREDDPLSDRGSASDVTQIRPQKIRMTLRPGTDQTNDVMIVSMRVTGLSHMLSFSLVKSHRSWYFFLVRLVGAGVNAAVAPKAHRALLDEVASKCWKNCAFLN